MIIDGLLIKSNDHESLESLAKFGVNIKNSNQDTRTDFYIFKFKDNYDGTKKLRVEAQNLDNKYVSGLVEMLSKINISKNVSISGKVNVSGYYKLVEKEENKQIIFDTGEKINLDEYSIIIKPIKSKDDNAIDNPLYSTVTEKDIAAVKTLLNCITEAKIS